MQAVVYTSSDTKRHDKSQLDFEKRNNIEVGLIKVYPQILKQKIHGFGGAFTEAAAETVMQMDEDTQKSFYEAYFAKEGNQYCFCRTHIQSCDFALGNYAYVTEPSDTELKTFSIERDKKYLIPMIKKALEYQPDLKLLASPWSPPAFMKSNGDMNYGGVLKKEYYAMWADMVAKYCEEYKKEGIEISYLTVQNEPLATQTWDSCIYTPEEEGDYAVNYLRPALEKRGLGHIKILIWDHNKDCIIERVQGTFSVDGAREAIDGVAFHWYTGDHFEALEEVGREYSDKELVFTEGCVEYSRFKDSSQVKNAEMYMHDILGNINSGMNAYIDWNLLLNEQGGPNHVGNYCDAPIMYDREEKKLDLKLSYHYIGHLSRYVLPGAQRILVSKYTDLLETVGFVNPNGERVLVLLNRSEKDVSAAVCEAEQSCVIEIKAHSIMTVCWSEA